MTKVLRGMKFPSGQTNPSGIKSRFFYADKDDIAVFARMKAEPTAIEDETTYEGDHEMFPGKYFVELYTTQGAGNMSFEIVGEKDSKMVNNKGTFSYPDLDEQAIAFVNRNMNSNGIIIAAYYTSKGVVWVQLGAEDFDIDILPKGQTGAKPGEKKGLEIEVTAPDSYALPRYKGLIPMENGTFNCATNKFTPKTGGKP